MHVYYDKDADLSIVRGKKVAIIGAGPAGLAAIKSLKQADLPVKCVEKNADVGGQWLYGAAPGADHPPPPEGTERGVLPVPVTPRSPPGGASVPAPST